MEYVYYETYNQESSFGCGFCEFALGFTECKCYCDTKKCKECDNKFTYQIVPHYITDVPNSLKYRPTTCIKCNSKPTQ